MKIGGLIARGNVQTTPTKDHLYLHSVAEVGSGSDSHHGQQARSCPDVQDDDLLATSLHSGHSRPDALVVLLILEAESPSAESVLKKSEKTLQRDLTEPVWCLVSGGQLTFLEKTFMKYNILYISSAYTHTHC